MKIVSEISEMNKISIEARKKIIERLEKKLREVPRWRFIYTRKITKEIEKFRWEIAHLKGE